MLTSQSELEAERLLCRPRTPFQEEPEAVSAFSPWDTPHRESQVTIHTTTTTKSSPAEIYLSSPTPASRIPVPRYKARRISSSSSIPKSPGCALSLNSGISSRSAQWSPKHSEFSLSSSYTTNNSTTHSPLKDKPASPTALYTPSSPPGDKVTWDRCNDLEWTLGHLQNAVKDFPSNLLLIDSPVIIHMRQSDAIDDSVLSFLHKIFPTTSFEVLSALAAAMFAHAYIVRVGEDSPSSKNEQLIAHESESYPSSTVADLSFAQRMAALSSHPTRSGAPTKARETFGTRLPLRSITTAQIHEQNLIKRAQILAAGFNVIVDFLLCSICSDAGVFDDEPKPQDKAVLRRSIETLLEAVEIRGHDKII